MGETRGNRRSAERFTRSDLEGKRVAELREIAGRMQEIPRGQLRRMRKPELIETIEQAQPAEPVSPEVPEFEAGHDGVRTPRKAVADLKHQVHRFHESIHRFQEEGAVLRERGEDESARRIEQKAAVLEGELAKLEQEAARLPDIADALGLAPVADFEPPELSQIVEPATFESVELPVKERRSLGFTQLNADWPRTGRVVRDGEVVSTETLGKLRIKLRDPQGGSAPSVPFRVTAKDKQSGTRVTLRQGRTDGQGYAAVNLGRIEADRVTDVAIDVEAGAQGESGRIRTIDPDELVTHRDLRIPHELTLRPDIAERLRDWFRRHGTPQESGTIDDPDDVDIQYSPESFGLNEEHVDGNCCLRPRADVAAREYHFRQIVRHGEADLVINGRPVKRQEVRGPIPFGEDKPGEYSVKGGGLMLGAVNMYRQGWHPVGRGLGELLYSLALAPCEQVNLAFIDWSREEEATRDESRTARERMEHELNRDRSVDEVVDSVLEEQQSGNSVSAGGGASLDLGFFSIGGGGGGTTSSTEGRRELHASTVQNVSDNVAQKASAVRSQRTTVVTTSSQQESERIQTRTVHNHNRNHAMTVQYFQVVSHYAVKTELVEEKPVLLVPYEVDRAIFDDIPSFDKFVTSPSRPITRFLDRHSALLRRMVPRRFRGAFDSLSRLLHCRDVYAIEQPYATVSRWRIRMDKAWRAGISLRIETESGQSIALHPRGAGSAGQPVEFVSDPVRTEDIRNLRIGFDPTEAVRSIGNSGLFGALGDRIGEMLESTINHKLSQVEITATTDRSRFVPQPQTFRLEVEQPDHTLSADNPHLELDVTPPNVNFDGYRGREHQDYCRLKELIAHIQSQPMRFIRAIWYYEDPDRRALRLDRFSFQGRSLLDSIVNRPVGVSGNYVAFELLEGHRLVQLEEPDYTVSSRLVSLPTRGVFVEVYLSCCNATEKRDVERFIDPDQACQVRAPEISGITPGSRASRPDTTPTDFPQPMVSVQNAPGAPDPTGMSSAMNLLGTPDIFRDLSRGAELLQFIDNATKEAFTSTREHRKAMNDLSGDILRGIIAAKTGVPIPGGGGNGGEAGAGPAGTPGITSTPSGTGGSGPNRSGPGGRGGPAGSGGGSPLDVLSSQMARQTSPSQLSDHAQTIRRAVDSGLLSEGQGQRLTNAMLGGTDHEDGAGDAGGKPPKIILTEPASRDGLAFGSRAGDKSGRITLTATVTGAPDDAVMRWSRPNPDAFELSDDRAASVDVTPLRPGRQEMDFIVDAADGTQLASIKVPLSVPQFVAIREDSAVLDDALEALHVDDVKESVLQEAKAVSDLILSTANVRTIWEMAPFGESLPAHLAAGGVAADTVAVATLRGHPPVPGLMGAICGGRGNDCNDDSPAVLTRGCSPWGPEAHDEIICVWPGAYLNVPALSLTDAFCTVDPLTVTVVQAMQNLDYTDPDLKALAIRMFGRLIGETLAHEIIHALIGRFPNSTGGHHPNPLDNDIMNRGRDRDLRSRTGIEVVDLDNFPAPGSFIDHGIGFINIPTAETQDLIDEFFPTSV